MTFRTSQYYTVFPSSAVRLPAFAFLQLLHFVSSLRVAQQNIYCVISVLVSPSVDYTIVERHATVQTSAKNRLSAARKRRLLKRRMQRLEVRRQLFSNLFDRLPYVIVAKFPELVNRELYYFAPL
jgi:hypothetical protein